MNILIIFGILISVLNLANCKIYYENSEPIVEISQGKVLGKTLKSREGRDYFAFLGIPYAKIYERFEDPVEADNWVGILNGTQYGAMCIQLEWLNANDLFGQEDCLYINVFVPKNLDPNKKVPVMFFTHGGAFRSGGGDSYRANYFMDEDVILITYNYRLAALGFLNTRDGLYGNMGFKDQNFALRWTNKNIERFGGDRNKITIFGESAGAASSHFHTISPLSKGLFNNVIMQSASALAFFSFDPMPGAGRNTEILAKELKCPTDNTKSMIKCLKEIDVMDFVRAQRVLFKWYKDPAIWFAGSLEIAQPGKTKESIFLSDTPYNILKNGEINASAIIMGVNLEEGLFINSIAVLMNEERTKEINQDFEKIAPITFMYEKHVPKSKMNQFSQEIKQFYFGNKEISWDTVQELTDLYSDSYFMFSVKLAALLHAKNGAKVYPYILDQRGKSILPALGIPKEIADKYGATHGDDLQYQFNMDEFGFDSVQDDLLDFSKTWVSSWVHFTQYNEPKDFGKEKWRPISQNAYEDKLQIEWYHLNKNSKMKKEVFEERMKFWRNLDEKYDFFQQRKGSKDEL